MVEDFVYTTDIEEIKPMTLNLTIVERTNKSRTNKKVHNRFRKPQSLD
jgi:hypothetical protein